jgi:hypothetical protein
MTNAEREIIIILSVLVAWGLVRAVLECTLLHAKLFSQMGELRNQTRESCTYTYRPHCRRPRHPGREIHRSGGEFGSSTEIAF